MLGFISADAAYEYSWQKKAPISSFWLCLRFSESPSSSMI